MASSPLSATCKGLAMLFDWRTRLAKNTSFSSSSTNRMVDFSFIFVAGRSDSDGILKCRTAPLLIQGVAEKRTLHGSAPRTVQSSGMDRLAVMLQPVKVEAYNELSKFGKQRSLYQVRIGTEFVRPLYIFWFIGGSKNDHDQVLKPGMLTHPSQHFKPALPGHLQVH